MSDHIARRWARDEVHRLLAVRDSEQELAIATPVSGAVVSETDAQYKANGLEASAPKNSPAVPEPAAYGLLMSGALPAFAFTRRKRR